MQRMDVWCNVLWSIKNIRTVCVCRMANSVVVNETHKAEVLLHNLVVFCKVIWSAVLTGRWVRAGLRRVEIVSQNQRSERSFWRNLNRRSWWGGNCGAIYRRGSEGRTQSTGSNMTISDMHSWISRTTTWVGVVVSAKYVWVQNSSANYVWVWSLWAARLLNLSRLWLVLRQTVVVQTRTADIVVDGVHIIITSSVYRFYGFTFTLM